MNWILIMWILGDSTHISPTLTTATFSSPEACENAGQIFVQKAQNNGHFRLYFPYYVCAPTNTLSPVK